MVIWIRSDSRCIGRQRIKWIENNPALIIVNNMSAHIKIFYRVWNISLIINSPSVTHEQGRIAIIYPLDTVNPVRHSKLIVWIIVKHQFIIF